MRDFLPTGLKGLLIAAFFAAYMSTIATQLNWGTSYIINDFYRRFISKKKDEKHYVLSSRVTTLLLMIVSVIVTLFISSISGAWQFVMECGAGVGLVLILRWFWWRINAWSEITAMIVPFILYPVISSGGVTFPNTLFIIVPVTTIAWLIVTFLTPPTEYETLKSFYRKIHPGGILWKKISDTLPEVKSDGNFIKMFTNWIFGVVLVYSILFGTGMIIFGEYLKFFIYAAAASVSAFVIYKNISGTGWEAVD
jgi:Na+/proline symporter